MVTAHIEIKLADIDVINAKVHRWKEQTEAWGILEWTPFCEVEWDWLEWQGSIIELSEEDERKLESYLTEVVYP